MRTRSSGAAETERSFPAVMRSSAPPEYAMFGETNHPLPLAAGPGDVTLHLREA